MYHTSILESLFQEPFGLINAIILNQLMKITIKRVCVNHHLLSRGFGMRRSAGRQQSQRCSVGAGVSCALCECVCVCVWDSGG
jgi:hypothetical protein